MHMAPRGSVDTVLRKDKLAGRATTAKKNVKRQVGSSPRRQRNADIAAGIGTEQDHYSILYVSRSLLSPENMEADVATLVKRAASRNIENAITGALVFTGKDFAQLIEGRRASVDRLMADIRADTRHSDIVVLRAAEESARRFAAWSLAYGGFSPLIAAIVDRSRLAAMNGLDRGARDLLRFMERFAVRPHRDQVRQDWSVVKTGT